MKKLLKFLVIGIIAYAFIIHTLDSSNMSYPEKFCKTYNSWNKNAWAVRNNTNTETWLDLQSRDYNTLQNLVNQNDPALAIPLSKYANQWFMDGSSGDVQSGVAMAAMLIVECEKYKVIIDTKWLK
jgi:uncharacterized alpha-E superfamily protein